MDGLKFLWIAFTLLTFFSKMATTVKRERLEYARDLIALVAKPYRGTGKFAYSRLMKFF